MSRNAWPALEAEERRNEELREIERDERAADCLLRSYARHDEQRPDPLLPYVTLLGRHRKYDSAAEVAAYDRAFLAYPAMPDAPAGTPASVAWHDADDIERARIEQRRDEQREREQ